MYPCLRTLVFISMFSRHSGPGAYSSLEPSCLAPTMPSPPMVAGSSSPFRFIYFFNLTCMSFACTCVYVCLVPAEIRIPETGDEMVRHCHMGAGNSSKGPEPRSLLCSSLLLPSQEGELLVLSARLVSQTVLSSCSIPSLWFNLRQTSSSSLSLKAPRHFTGLLSLPPAGPSG